MHFRVCVVRRVGGLGEFSPPPPVLHQLWKEEKNSTQKLYRIIGSQKIITVCLYWAFSFSNGNKTERIHEHVHTLFPVITTKTLITVAERWDFLYFLEFACKEKIIQYLKIEVLTKTWESVRRGFSRKILGGHIIYRIQYIYTLNSQ